MAGPGRGGPALGEVGVPKDVVGAARRSVAPRRAPRAGGRGWTPAGEGLGLVAALQRAHGNQAVLRALGSRAGDAVPRLPGAGPRRGASPSAWIQRVKMYRYVTPTNPGSFTAKLPIPSTTTVEAHLRQLAQMLEEDSLTVAGAAELHAQNALGVENAWSPFVSLSYDQGLTAVAGSLRVIVQNATHLYTFNIPEELIYPVSNTTSLGESEALVLLPPGRSLEHYAADMQANPFRGLSQEQIAQQMRTSGYRGHRVMQLDPGVSRMPVILYFGAGTPGEQELQLVTWGDRHFNADSARELQRTVEMLFDANGGDIGAIEQRIRVPTAMGSVVRYLYRRYVNQRVRTLWQQGERRPDRLKQQVGPATNEEVLGGAVERARELTRTNQ
jgi:hypothetical protein